MIFKEAYEALKQGALIKLPEWAGYWKWENNSIKMHCKDGVVLDIRQSEDVDYTLGHILRDDWEIVKSPNLTDLNIQTFSFGEALRKLKNKERVARRGWNGTDMWLCLIPHTNNSWKGFPMQDCIGLKNNHDEMQPGWVPTQADMLAMDWYVVE